MQFYYFTNKIEIITIIISEESLFFFFSVSASQGRQQSLAHGSFSYNTSTPALVITDDIRVSSLFYWSSCFYKWHLKSYFYK